MVNEAFVVAKWLASAGHVPIRSFHFTNVTVCGAICPQNARFTVPALAGSFANSIQNACTGLHPSGNSDGNDWPFSGVRMLAVSCARAPGPNAIVAPPAFNVPPAIGVNVTLFVERAVNRALNGT